MLQVVVHMAVCCERFTGLCSVELCTVFVVLKCKNFYVVSNISRLNTYWTEAAEVYSIIHTLNMYGKV